MRAVILGIAKSIVASHWQLAFFVFVIIQAILTALCVGIGIILEVIVKKNKQFYELYLNSLNK